MDSLGHLIRSYRSAESRNEGRGEYAQAKVAERAQISVATLRAYERDTIKHPRRKVIAAIARALACDAAETNKLYSAAGLEQYGIIDPAFAQLKANLADAEQAGDDTMRARILSELAQMQRKRGDIAKAEALFQQSLEINRALANGEGVNANLAYLGMLYLDQGDLEKGVNCLQEARKGFVDMGRTSWVQQIDAVMYAQLQKYNQAQAQAKAEQGPTLRDVVMLVKIGAAGNAQAQAVAKPLCQQLVASGIPELTALGQGLVRLMDGVAPEEALVDVPAVQRDFVLAILSMDSAASGRGLRDVVSRDETG